MLKDRIIGAFVYRIDTRTKQKGLAIVPIKCKVHQEGESNVTNQRSDGLKSYRRVLDLFDGLVQEGLVNPEKDGIIQYKKDEDGEHI